MTSVSSRHIDHVLAVGLGGARASGPAALFHKSWARCIKQHGLDPARPMPARILPQHQLREHQQRMDGFLRVARAGMEDMYRRVASLGYMLLLTDADGITVDYIGNPATEPQLKAAGLYLGADWNEAHAGTCGVGTCLIEQQAITCHLAEHFDATHIGLTCTSAPLFAPDGQLLGVLDVSALRSPEARESQALTLQLTLMYAQLIEDANFLRCFAKHWILRLGTVSGLAEVSGEVMFAFDTDGVIQGANTGARRRFGNLGGFASTGSFGAAGGLLLGQTLTELLGIDMDAVRRMARGGLGAALTGQGSAQHLAYYPAVLAPRQAAEPLLASQTVAAARLTDAARPATPAATTPTTAAAPLALDHLCGADPAMQRLVAQAKRLVDRRVNLLISGETGSGKEVLARALHSFSQRAALPFVAVNCAAIPESLIESELFGYTPGSFTGGKSRGMKGLIAQSDGGTLFLDEIGDMPLQLQTRFLRVLSESEVLPLGAERPLTLSLQVMAASHRDLLGAVERGLFREDLYYRLCGATLNLPPLRQRSDLRYLIESVLEEEAARVGVTATLLPEALQRLLAHHWPGNIRELRNALRFALALSEDGRVSVAELPPALGRLNRLDSMPTAGSDQSPPKEQSDELNPEPAAALLLQTLQAQRWNISATAQALNLCRATVYRQMKRHQIRPPHRL
ncbi:sigma-54-dependent Fis family transcriptional regulator [Roseateles sp. GG27B]